MLTLLIPFLQTADYDCLQKGDYDQSLYCHGSHLLDPHHGLLSSHLHPLHHYLLLLHHFENHYEADFWNEDNKKKKT
jgi:hypothetical protein